jgi:hypothetical protein
MKPYRFGGWLPAVYCGVDTSFLWYDHTPEDIGTLSACSLHKLERPIKRSILKSKGIYHGPVEHIFGPNLDVGSSNDLYTYKLNFGQVYRLFTGFKTEGSLFYAYELLRSQRQKSYNKFFSSPLYMSPYQVYQSFVEHNPYIDFLPKSDWVKAYDIEDFKCEEVLHPLTSNINRYLGYLAYMNPNNKELWNVVPNPMPPSINLTEKSLTSFEREFSRRIPVGIGGTYSTLPLTTYALPDVYDFSHTDWICPERVVMAYKANFFLPQIPVNSFFVKEKLQVNFFRYSDFNQWISSSPYTFIFKYLVKRLGWRTMNKQEYCNDEFYTDHLVSVLKELRPFKGKTALTVPLPPPEEDEISFFYGDIFAELRNFIGSGFTSIAAPLSDFMSDEEEEDPEPPEVFWESFKETKLFYSDSSSESVANSHALSVDGSRLSVAPSCSDSSLSCEDPFANMHQDDPGSCSESDSDSEREFYSMSG